MNYYSLLLLSVCAGASVVVDLGENITLNCSYSVSYYGRLNSCWSRGVLPSYGMCGVKTIISSNRSGVIKSVSQRYVLGEHLDKGDVSLTILNVTREDAGTYGCRVDIPWISDQKHHFTLKIRQADRTSASPLHTTTASDNITISPHMTSSDHVTFSDLVTPSDHVTRVEPIWTSPGPRLEEAKTSTVLLVSLLLPLLFIITATILIIMRKWRLFQKM
ncbi:hepatitis A virus cellular receptor 1 homolog isoform X2 [Boleophthalmus pectinirostris]|uniref:hepatitis A virus cellular receptor 1 homolog isoform X2 n=1 Tax=Boleophthalmus pectinirostris TaxID=150288 RepID=UPI0024300798|nr:hepatitis A virus cellular receptor 1 homolog isoform X2 [Boleophthalmus pectinirostris]